jgi:DNA-binding transcriptional MerR regulator
MRMSELSTTTGVAVPTLKFYLREGLLPAGERTSPNQAQYDDRHVERVRLVRALLEIGGLSVAQAAAVVRALDDDLPLTTVFGAAQRAVTVPAPLGSGVGEDGAERIAALCALRGWRVHTENPGLEIAARVIDAYGELGLGHISDGALDPYADAADLVARADLDAVARSTDLTQMVEVVVVGTVLGDALFAGLRRIAQEVESTRRFPLPERDPAPADHDHDHDHDDEEHR